MPFGNESSSDPVYTPTTLSEYHDSHQCLSATSPLRTPDTYGKSIDLDFGSPMPFGNESSSDTRRKHRVLPAGGNCHQCLSATSPLRTLTAYKAALKYGGSHQCLSATSPLRTTRSTITTNQPYDQSPMPFGNESSSDCTPLNILGLRSANGF